MNSAAELGGSRAELSHHGHFQSLIFVSHPEHRIRQPAAERVVVLELFEKLSVFLKHRRDFSLESLVVLDASVLPVGVLPRVLVGPAMI